jgi:hypothetical protein
VDRIRTGGSINFPLTIVAEQGISVPRVSGSAAASAHKKIKPLAIARISSAARVGALLSIFRKVEEHGSICIDIRCWLLAGDGHDECRHRRKAHAMVETASTSRASGYVWTGIPSLGWKYVCMDSRRMETTTA